MTPPSWPLNPDFHDMLAELGRAGAEHLVIGAFAVSAYGHVRTTKDLDIFVRASPENAPRVYEALRRFGAPLERVTVEDFAAPGTILQVGVAPRRIDLTTAIDGVSFDEAVVGRVLVPVGDLAVPVIGRVALLRNKRASARPQDLADVEALEALGPELG